MVYLFQILIMCLHFLKTNFVSNHYIVLGLTLASQWKSQFDDSEETDNEWKGENLQSPEHRHQLASQVRHHLCV